MRFVIAAKRLPYCSQETAADPSGHDEGVPVAKRHDRWHVCMLLADSDVSAWCCMLSASYEMNLTSQLSRIKSQKKRSAEDRVHGDGFDLKIGVC